MPDEKFFETLVMKKGVCVPHRAFTWTRTALKTALRVDLCMMKRNPCILAVHRCGMVEHDRLDARRLFVRVRSIDGRDDRTRPIGNRGTTKGHAAISGTYGRAQGGGAAI